MALTEAVNFRGNFSSDKPSLGSHAGPPAGSVAGLDILGFLSCLVLCIGAHIAGDNRHVRQVDSSPYGSFSAIRIGVMPMGLLPDTQNCGCACAGNAGNVFPVTAGKRSRHASRHVRHARAVMHAGIAK